MRVPGGSGSQISRHSAHEGGKVVSPTHRPPLPSQEIFLVLISVRGCVNPRAIVRPEGLCQWKIPITPWGIEPATFRLVAHRLNEMRNRLRPKQVGRVCEYNARPYRGCSSGGTIGVELWVRSVVSSCQNRVRRVVDSSDWSRLFAFLLQSQFCRCSVRIVTVRCAPTIFRSWGGVGSWPRAYI